MRIVKLDELDDEERKRVIQEQQQRVEQNNIERTSLQQSANESFNSNIQKNEGISNINLPPVRNTENSIWSKILGVGQNAWLGAVNGVKSLQQTVGRAMTNTLAERADMVDENTKLMTTKLMEEDPEKAQALIKNSQFISGDTIRNDAQEQYEKIQLQKEANQAKIEENANDMNSELGRYLTGNILPTIGQMAPGFIGGPVGTTYFIGSATGNYYDDAKQRGMNENQATAYSGIMGVIEGSLESIGAKLTTNVGKQLLKKNIKGALVNYGLDIAENFLEESIVEPIQEVVAGATANKANWEDIGQRFIKSGVDGAIVSAITGGISGTVGRVGSNFRSNQYIDANTSKTLSKDTQNWLNTAKNIINENSSSGVNQIVKQEKIDNQQVNTQYEKKFENGNNETVGINKNINQEQEIANEKALSQLEKNGDFSEQVDKYLSGNLKSSDTLYLGDTPDIIQKLGISNNPMTMKQSKLKTILSESNNSTDNIHGLSAEMIKKIPEAIANPLNILKSSTQDNSVVIITDLADKNERPIIASIKVDDQGRIGNIDFLTNRLASTYGKDNYDRFMQTEIAKGNLLYDIDEGIIKELPASTRLQLPEGFSSFDETSSFINNSITPNEQNVKGNTTTTNDSMQKNTRNILTKSEKVDWNNIERLEDNKKSRKHYKSIIESSQTTKEAKVIAKELMGTDSYIPETNKGQLLQADQRITNSGPDAELQSLLSKAVNGEKINSIDIAVGERLIQYFSKTGNKKQLQEAIQATALAGTSAGQTVQALAILNHQTPQGQATWIKRSVDKMNKELAKKKGGTITTDENGNQIVVNKQGKDITNKVNLFDLTPEMLEKIINSENKEQMYKNIDEVYEELGQQIPKSVIEKVDSWRYFSMLANIRTHGRNMIGNTAMGLTQSLKNKVAGGIEGVVSKFNPDMERNHTLVLVDKKTRDFSKNDFKNIDVQSRLELNENKYNPQSRLQNARRTFKSDLLESTLGRLFNINDKLLEAEDGLGLKSGYIKAMNEYLTANKIDVDKITDTQLNKARNYAIEQAKEATFHQANVIASAVSQFQNKNNITKFFVDAILPFKKTPMNVAKGGIEYSPVGFLKASTVDLARLRKGNITINQYIDNLSKGLTGTGIAFAGYALAKAGVLKASGSDDNDKEKFDEEQGKQSYAITIGGKTYSLDWLAPTGIPLFIGAEFQRLSVQNNSEKSTEKTNDESKLSEIVKSVANIANAGATSINPMSEMSMISGLTSVLSSYKKENALGDMMTNAGKSYVNQFVPTLLGQVAKITDDYERTTTSTKTRTIEKAVDQTINQVKSKVPGLRQTLPIKTDIWGRNKETEPNLPLRAFNSFVNPATVKNVSTDKVDKELNKLYDVNNNNSILPDVLQKTLTIDGQKYRLTNKEYADYTKKYGETSYKIINNLISSSEYKSMSKTQKEEAISNVYAYAKEANKLDYAKNNNLKVDKSTLYKIMSELNTKGKSQYLGYIAKTSEMKKSSQKNEFLAKSNYSNETKSIIYKNTIGKEDSLYNEVLKNTNINITEYLNYKVKELNDEFASNKDEEGNAISGTSKKKYYDYINKNITGYGNRLLILGNKYKLSDTERKALVDYINKNNSKSEVLEICKKLNKNFTVKNGKVYYK